VVTEERPRQEEQLDSPGSSPVEAAHSPPARTESPGDGVGAAALDGAGGVLPHAPEQALEREVLARPGTRMYRRLALGSSGAPGILTVWRASLWRGPDHLLLVRRMWFYEEYRRFFFNDIEAFVLRRTRTGEVLSILLTAVAGACLVGMVIARTLEWRPFFGTCGTAALVFLVVNFLLGPTCYCAVRTPVQITYLPPLGRVRKALKVIRAISPLIEAAQNDLPSLQTVLERADGRQQIERLLGRAPLADNQQSGAAHSGTAPGARRAAFWLQALSIVLTAIGVFGLFLAVFPTPSVFLAAVSSFILTVGFIPGVAGRLPGVKKAVSLRFWGPFSFGSWWLIVLAAVHWATIWFAGFLAGIGARNSVRAWGDALRKYHSFFLLSADAGLLHNIVAGMFVAAAAIALVTGIVCLFHLPSVLPQVRRATRSGPPPLPPRASAGRSGSTSTEPSPDVGGEP